MENQTKKLYPELKVEVVIEVLCGQSLQTAVCTVNNVYLIC